jgi:DNA-binding SARP family transcriptional activator
VDFGILGPLVVWDGGRVRQLPGARERAVLTYLLLRAGEVVPADRLVDELWGEDAPRTARKSLGVRIAGIRKVVGKGVVVSQGAGYVALVGRDQLDLRRFEHLVAESETAEPRVAAERLRQALGLWRGPPLDELGDVPFAMPAIARLEELRTSAVERRIDADLALGRHADLVAELGPLVGQHPFRERFRCQLMLALYRSGRQADALAAYADARRALVDALGIEPGYALRDLERAILRQDPALLLSATQAPERSILVVLREGHAADGLAAVAQLLASSPPKELIYVLPVGSAAALAAAAAAVEERRLVSVAHGIAARGTAFVTTLAAPDLVRLGAHQEVDLVLVSGSSELLRDADVGALLDEAPCDVAVLVGGVLQEGPVLVPFVGAEHDWAAIELGAWLARASGVPLLVAGPLEGPPRRDASRLLSDASLAVQRALGVAARPLLLEPGAASLLAAADDAGVVVLGLSDRWRAEGLGRVRETVARYARPAVALVRSGLRPGGLAPPAGRTRFTWSIRG